MRPLTVRQHLPVNKQTSRHCKYLLERYRRLALSSENADCTSIVSQIRLKADEKDWGIGAKMSHLGIPLFDELQDLNLGNFNSSYLVGDIL